MKQKEEKGVKISWNGRRRRRGITTMTEDVKN